MRSFALAVVVGSWSKRGSHLEPGLELRDGPISVAGWIPGRNALPVRVVQGGARLLGFGWGQLVALSTDLSPTPRGGQCLSSPLDQVTFRSAGGRGRAQHPSLWGDERSKATGIDISVSSRVTHQQSPQC